MTKISIRPATKLLALLFAVMPMLTACVSDQRATEPLAPVASAMPVNMNWERHLADGSRVDFTKLTPAIDGQQLFVAGSRGQITASNLATGKPMWSTTLKQGISGGPAAGSGNIYVPTTDGELYALRQTDGAIQWHIDLPDQSNTVPTYSNGQVFVKTIDDQLLSLNATTGQQNWKYDEGATQLQLLGSSSVAVKGNAVVAGFSDGKLNAIDAANGALVWQAMVGVPQGFTDMSRMVGIAADPIIYGGTAYAASYHGNIAAVDMSTGRIIWQHPLSVFAGIAVSNNAVFASDSKGRVWAFDKSDGTVLWKQTALVGRQVTGPAVTGNYIVVADSAGSVHWLSQQDGHFVARTAIGNVNITTTPQVTNQGVIVYANNGTVALLNLQN
jgi:outer membrane protein assembly factor BamB